MTATGQPVTPVDGGAAVLVTGALGNVGREVVRECVERGLPVRATYARAAPAPPRDGVTWCRLDFLDRATWGPALDRCRSVFLLRPPPLGDMRATLCPFVDAAYAAGVEQVVFLSVAGADRMKWVPHRVVELYLAARAGAGWTVLRPGFFAQNLQDAYRRDIVEDRRIYVPAGRGRVAFIDLRDIGAVAARVLGAPADFAGQSLTLTGPEAIDFEQVAALLSRVLGREVRYRAASLLGYAYHLKVRRGLPWRQVAIQSILHRGLARGDAAEVEPTVERVLGRRARSMAEYVEAERTVWR